MMGTLIFGLRGSPTLFFVIGVGRLYDTMHILFRITTNLGNTGLLHIQMQHIIEDLSNTAT